VNFDKNLILRVATTKYGKNQPSEQLTTQIMGDIEKAKQQINSINKINYVNNPNMTANAYWQPSLPNQISVVCNNIGGQDNMEFNLTILIHELQHSIHQYIGPVKSWDQAYIKKTLPGSMPMPRMVDAQHPYTFWDKTKDKLSSLFSGGDKKYEDLGDKKFDKGWIMFMNQKNEGLKYSCNADEVQSRVAQVRSRLKLPPGAPITIEMLKDDETYKQFFYNLLCWANRKDNISLQDYLNSLNMLVMNKGNNKVTQNQV
jgi:hypothetical protein